jgi:hypothetical protein
MKKKLASPWKKKKKKKKDDIGRSKIMATSLQPVKSWKNR